MFVGADFKTWLPGRLVSIPGRRPNGTNCLELLIVGIRVPKHTGLMVHPKSSSTLWTGADQLYGTTRSVFDHYVARRAGETSRRRSLAPTEQRRDYACTGPPRLHQTHRRRWFSLRSPGSSEPALRYTLCACACAATLSAPAPAQPLRLHWPATAPTLVVARPLASLRSLSAPAPALRYTLCACARHSLPAACTGAAATGVPSATGLSQIWTPAPLALRLLPRPQAAGC
jgi:hypothetical protein